ncbi:hypothetical protein [Novosphingobium sp. KN65.2]|uniref:hypothetical protein n=1 Tax=Novosphingobium sp. KN65.2 TaxID=1478134 RepID=UPI000ADBDCAC|nr:hypothetical protein [Novosphingobium sp. KN65.2]
MSNTKRISCDCGYGNFGVYIHAPDCPAMTLDLAADFIGVRIDKEVTDEADHFMNCIVCGQSFDMRRLDEVMYHEMAGHERRVRQ